MSASAALTFGAWSPGLRQEATPCLRCRLEQPAKEVAVARPPRSNTRPRSIHMTNAATQSDANVVDVRSLVPAQRHAKIFQLVNELKPGASFTLVNDHDPKPLYYQLEAEYPNQFSWTYLERGPEVWRVEIGKIVKAA